MDDVSFERKSFGNSFAPPKPFSTPEEVAPILCDKLQRRNLLAPRESRQTQPF